MNQIFLTFFIYLITTLFFYASIIGYGKSVIFFSNKSIFKDYKIIEYLFGLILIGFFGSLIIFISNINNLISISIILIGLFLFFIFFYIEEDKKNQLIAMLIVTLISIIFSFYAGVNDDYGYHFETIKNFKSYNIYEINHHRWISYNSHWLLINSIFYIDFNTTSLFVLASLIYSIALFDLYKLFNKLDSDKDNFKIASFLILIFFIGILNKYKDYGTDFPGVVISVFIFLIFLNQLYYNKKIDTAVFLTIAVLANFAFIIKITNALIFIFVIIAFFKSKYILKNFFYLIVLSAPVFLWFFQNLIISGCLVWPITFLCFDNIELAKNEMFLIQSFAKGDIQTSLNPSGFEWISTWLTNHSNKLIEVYFLYFCLLMLPLILFKYKKKYKIFDIYKNFITLDNYNMIKFIALPIFLSNLVWFFYTPAYRFGVFYNLSFLIIIALPFWNFIYQNEKLFFKKYTNILIFIALIFFLIEFTTKFKKNYIKYDGIWPPIVKNQLTVL